MFAGADVPRWVSELTTERFFNACVAHEEAKKNEKNVFCLDCCEAICPHCLHLHRPHRLLQIRRYVYHDVLRLGDADKLIDCAHVQSYTTNSAKVVFINQRPLSRLHRASGNFCICCTRNLQDSYLFCSLSCKMQHILRTEGKLYKYLRRCESLALSEQGSEDGHMTPDSVLEQTDSVRTDSGGSPELSECPAISSAAEVVRKKRSALSVVRSAISSTAPTAEVLRPACRPVSRVNRRKGTPHRSPLY